MTRHLTAVTRPPGASPGLDLDLIEQLPPSLPPTRTARMIEQRLESWQAGDALLAWQRALDAWLAPLPAPLPVAARIEGRRQ